MLKSFILSTENSQSYPELEISKKHRLVSCEFCESPQEVIEVFKIKKVYFKTVACSLMY